MYAILILCLSAAPFGRESMAQEQAPPGHERMLRLLLQVAKESRANSRFTGSRMADELRSKLAAMGKSGSPVEKWRLTKRLAAEELRLGNLESSVKLYAEARGLLDETTGKGRERAVTATLYESGVAWLRMAVSRNCLETRSPENCILPMRESGTHLQKEAALEAIDFFTQVLKMTKADSTEYIEAKWLLNIACMLLGKYPDEVPDPFVIPPAVFASEEEFPRFVNVAPSLGLNTRGHSGGAVAEDFDGDDLLDVMVSSSNQSGQIRYFRNNGDGSFSDLTEESGLLGLTGGLNMVQADYDNDGDSDVFVLRGAWGRRMGRHPNSLLRNNGDNTFTDVTFQAGLGKNHWPTQTATWLDYENDGDLDLYVGNEFELRTKGPSQLFRNDGDGTFTDVAKEAGVQNRRYAKAVVSGDYDNDGCPDIFVSNMASDNRLYHNNCDGTFTDVAKEAGVSLPVSGFPSWFWDFDNDGALDLFAAAFGGRAISPDLSDVAASYLGLPHEGELDRLYRGDGSGSFKDVSIAQNLTKYTLPMGSNFGDLDNDGFLDFYLGTGFPLFEGLMPNVMYRNRGGTGFSDVTMEGGFGHLQKGHGVAFADFDNDGDQDVFQTMGGAYPEDTFDNSLYENPGFGHHWITIRLVGSFSNRSAIGTRIRIDITEDGEKRSIYRHVSTGGSFGCSPLRQEIGLGRAETIDTLELYWPASQLTQTFKDVDVDQFLEITEGQDEFRHVTLKGFSLSG